MSGEAGAAGGAREEPPVLSLGMNSADDRSRLLAAALATITERGYRATTVTQIAARAGLAQPLFYRYFEGKEDCFLAAYELMVAWLGSAIEREVQRSVGWPRQVRAAVAAALDCLAAEPRLARFCGMEVLFAGPAARQRQQAVVEQLASLLRAGRAESGPKVELPSEIEQILVGGAIWLVAYRARLDGVDSLSELTPELTYFLLVPYFDVEEAKRLAKGGEPLRRPMTSGD